MNPVGYLTKTQSGLVGEKGVYFDYILGSNGLFIETENKNISVCIPVANCEVRGLSPVDTRVSLTFGSIPQHFFDLAMETFLSDPLNEYYVAISAAAGYHFHVPVQSREEDKVVYEVVPDILMEIHSHGPNKAFFSSKDNSDERGLKLYAVVGNVNTEPVVRLRVGVYGYFMDLTWKDVFDGSLYGAMQYQEKEVINKSDLHGKSRNFESKSQNSSGGMWWDRWFRR